MTPHAKKLEDARLTVNHLVSERCAHEKDLTTQRQSLESMEDRMATEKESTIEKEDKEFEEREEAARKKHKRRKTGLINSISIRFHAEQLELDEGLRALEAKTPDLVAEEKTARDAYHKADIEYMEATVKRKIELDGKGGLKRKRGVSPVVPSVRGDR